MDKSIPCRVLLGMIGFAGIFIGWFVASMFIGRALMCDQKAATCPELQEADKGNLTSAEKIALKKCDAESESKLLLLTCYYTMTKLDKLRYG